MYYVNTISITIKYKRLHFTSTLTAAKYKQLKMLTLTFCVDTKFKLSTKNGLSTQIVNTLRYDITKRKNM